jgi:hypothetical protein
MPPNAHNSRFKEKESERPLEEIMTMTGISSDPTHVSHPVGTVRIISPTERAAFERLAAAATLATPRPHSASPRNRFPRMLSHAGEILRSFARLWVNAQMHRSGF